MDSSIIEFGHVFLCKKGCQCLIKNRMTNSVDPDETARYEPSHLDIQCLHRYMYLFLSAGVRELMNETDVYVSKFIVIK